MVDHLEEVSRVEEERWPQTLLDMVELMKDFNEEKLGMPSEAAHKDAQQRVVTFAHYFGARRFYLPRPARMQIELRNQRIFHEIGTKSAAELAQEHNLTESHIYDIVAEQKQRHIKKHQGKLFD